MKELIIECLEAGMIEEAKELLEMKELEESFMGAEIQMAIQAWMKKNRDSVTPNNNEWVHGFEAGYKLAKEQQ